ncbi:MAG: hypothetical protein JXQ73_24660 [Phycisphaerae bacterium]|nr:hypothetical protein [Phycisphaerae bacterium]
MLTHTKSWLSVLCVSTFAVALTGCQIGPSALKVSNAHYSDAVRIAISEQLLVNLVRLRYRDMPVFLDVSSISTQFEFGSSGDVSGTIVENVGGAGINTPDSLSLGAGVSYSEKPTITFTTLGGEKFQKRMLAPLEIAVISLLGESGWRGDRILRMTVEELNGLENAPGASGPTPSREPRYRDFLEAIRLMQNLVRAQLIDFEFEIRKVEIGSPILLDKVEAGDIVSAAGVGLVFETASEDKKMVATKEERRLVLRFARGAADSKEAGRLRELLRLKPDANRFDMIEAEESEFDALEPDRLMSELAVDTRSLMGVMYYLSNGVEPPPAHQKAGLVTVTVDADGMPIDWSDVLEDLFRVRSSPHRPRNAAVAVRHRGYWFYVADDDETSKSTFLLLQQLFSLQAGDVEAQKPVLTLPVGG